MMADGSLFPPIAYQKSLNDTLQAAIEASIKRVMHGSVVPTFDIALFRKELASLDFERPTQLDGTLLWTIEQLETGLVHINHPRYFGLFNPTPTFPAQCAERIMAAFNPQLATWTTSPAAVEIENHVVAAVAARAGLPPMSRGHFTTGGSEANYTGVLLALTRACPDFALDGARAFSGPPVFYVSRESHLAWIKIAHQAGIGRTAVRLVPTDGSGRMDADQLSLMIAADRGLRRVPVLIGATAGTTNAGMIDPLDACAAIARKEDIWFHVDAAWGGGLITSEKYRHRLSGIECADSITIDAHKWFGTTMGCGIFVTRHPTVLSSAFCASTTFMPSNIADTDPYVTSLQWSRRFSGLRLFLSLATAGWVGYGRHVEHMLSMSALLKSHMKRANWITLNDSPVGVLCLVPPIGRPLKPVVARVLASGRAWVSATTFEGREVIRACVTSGLTGPEDIAGLAGILVEANADDEELANVGVK